MIDRLVRSLARATSLSAEEILDVLWLSAIHPSGQVTALSEPAVSPAPDNPQLHTGEAPAASPGHDGRGLPLRLGGDRPGQSRNIGETAATRAGFGSPRPIRDALAIPKALHRLRQVRAPSRQLTVDIDATIEMTAEAGGRLLTVLTRPLERALDLVLAVDGAPSMRIWNDTFEEFERLLVQTSAFRTVSRLQFLVREHEVVITDPSGASHPPRRIVDPAGNRVILIATDASSESWYTQEPWDTIASWCQSMPVALIQVLPQGYWAQTALGEPYVTARAPRPASPNSSYVRQLAWWARDPGGPALPVVTLATGALETWAQAVVSGTAWATGITATPPDPGYAPSSAITETDAESLVNNFLSRASPGAERLARVLASAPALSIPLISVLQDTLPLETGVQELAEIMSSRLLENTSGSAGQQLFRFRQGTREILQRGITTFEEWDTYTAISRYLQGNRSLGGPLQVLFPDGKDSTSLDLGEDPFSELHETLATRLGLRTAPAQRPSPAAKNIPQRESFRQPEQDVQHNRPRVDRGDRPTRHLAAMRRPNFFTLLELDPAAPWDQAAYERALADSRNRWSRQSSGIKDDPVTVEAKRNLALIRDIRGVLLDPAKREEERAAARVVQADERQRRQDQLSRRLDLMLAKGFLYDVERDALVADGADAALVRRADMAEIRPYPQARQDHGRLAPDTERTLKANLAIVQHRDLYQLLATADPQVTETSPLEQLTAAADALYRKARTIADKTRPEAGALEVLAGLARRVFGSAGQRRRHDFSMRVAPMEAIAEQYAADLSPVRRVDARQFEVFLRTAAERGWNLTLAQEVFAGYLRNRGWTVETPPEPAAQRLSDQHLAEEAEAALARSDPDGAAVAVGDTQIAWPLSPDSDDELAVRLRTAARRAEQLRHTERTSLAQITRLMDGGSYHTAMTRLRSLGARSPASEAMLASCIAVVREADELCAVARRPGLQPDRRAELYLRAVELCADHREARRELRAIAPAPPRGLRVVVHEQEHRVSLTWEPAPDRGCSSVVVRADGPVPPVTATGPGLRRWLVRAGGSWEDEAPLDGLPMSYAVFTERDIDGTISARAATTTTPVLLTAPVTLTVRPGDAKAELSWTLPEHATGVEIHREEVPSGAGHVRLTPPATGLRQLTDANVRNGERYRYTVYARYSYLVPGRPEENRLSIGAVREVTPGPAPEPPGKVHVRGHPPPPGISFYRHRVKLSWPPSGPGMIRVLRTVPPARPIASGAELDEADLDQTVLKGSHQLREDIDIWLADPVPCWYTPVLVVGGRCYVGESRPYAPGPEVTELAADYAGTAARLTWTWPDGVAEALVSWDETAAPPDPLATTRQLRVSRAAYHWAGGYDIPARLAPELFIQVAAVIRNKDGEFVTSGTGVHVVRQPVQLRYKVRRGRAGWRPELVLWPDRPAFLPELRLHWRADQRPAGRDDPHTMVPPGRADGELVVPLSLARTTVVSSCRLLHADTADADMITIVGPVTA